MNREELMAAILATVPINILRLRPYADGSIKESSLSDDFLRDLNPVFDTLTCSFSYTSTPGSRDFDYQHLFPACLALTRNLKEYQTDADEAAKNLAKAITINLLTVAQVPGKYQQHWFDHNKLVQWTQTLEKGEDIFTIIILIFEKELLTPDES